MNKNSIYRLDTGYLYEVKHFMCLPERKISFITFIYYSEI